MMPALARGLLLLTKMPPWRLMVPRLVARPPVISSLLAASIRIRPGAGLVKGPVKASEPPPIAWSVPRLLIAALLIAAPTAESETKPALVIAPPVRFPPEAMTCTLPALVQG